MGNNFYQNEIKRLTNVINNSNEVHDQIIVSYEKELKQLKEVINKAKEFIKNKGGYCEEYKMTSRPFNTIELDDLLGILEEVQKWR